MPSTVSANGRGVIHQGSGGISIAFPDVCQTPSPVGPVPVPYPNIGLSLNAIGGPVTVSIDGMMPMVKGAKYLITSGDEAGNAGGVASGMILGEAEFMLYSFDIQFEGKNACRQGDPMFQNRKNAIGFGG